MSFTLVVELQAVTALKALPVEVRRAVATACAALQENPRPVGFVRLRSAGAYRVTVLGHRVLYVVDDRALVVRILDVRPPE
jgi:mRNA interferase RelE/StbE